MSKLTAAQIEKNCPDSIQDLGKRIAAHYDKLLKCEDKAEQHKATIGQLLVKANEACDKGGFNAFHARFCPQLGRSRAYELLQIASGKKTSEEIKSAKRESMKRSRAAKKAAAEVHNVVDSTSAGEPATDTPAHEASTSDGKPSKPRRGLKAPKAAETGEPRDLSVELAANPPAEASGEARKATMGTLGNAGASNAGEATAASQAAPSAEVRKVITDAVGDFGAGAIARVMAVTNLQVLPRKDLQLIVDHGAASGLAELIEQLRRVGAEFFAWADKLAKIEPEKEEPEAQTAEAALVQAINKVAKAEEGWWLEQAEHPVDGEIAWVRHDGILPPGPLLWRLVDLFELAAGFELDAETIVTAVKAAEVNGAR
jgi:hypothetical protein